jgi:hypothetical protein
VRLLRALGASVAAIGICVPGQLAAQETPSALDAVAPQNRIAMQPHRMILDGHTRSATVTLTNRSNKPTTAEVHVVFAYSVWPHGLPYDTTLFSMHWQSLVPHDTLVVAPRATDPSAAQWISGVPTQVILKPHETRRMTVHLTPPPQVPNREYWAKIVAIVNPQRKLDKPAKPKDEKTVYRLPIRGIIPQPIRDSTLVFSRPGAVTMGLALAGPVAAALDVRDEYPRPPVGCPCRRVWYRIPVHLTGNAVYQGTLRVRYVNVETGQAIWEQAWELTLYHDAVIHGWSEFHQNFPSGKYRFIATFDNAHSEVDKDHQLPMRPVADTVLFEASE